MARLRRFLLLLSLAFSFGGFTFYAAVVVPIGGAVLDTTTQGFVTQKVTHVINIATCVTVILLTWEAIVGRNERGAWNRRALLASIMVLALGCGVLVALHLRLDALLDATDFSVSRPDRFYRLHQGYLWVSTAQWLSSIVAIWVLASDER